MSHAAAQAAFAAALNDPGRALPPGLAGEVAESRFAVYRNNVAMGLIKALGESFPVTARLVGDDFFHRMAKAYAAIRKPASPLLFAYGADFGDFIAGFAPAATLPYLADVARLEAARLGAYHAAEAEPLAIATLAVLSAEALAATCLMAHPAAGLLASAHPIGAIWQAHQRDAVAADFTWRAETVLIVRPAADVALHVLPPDAAAFAQALFAGASLGAAAEAVLARHADFDFGTTLAGLAGLGAFAAPPTMQRTMP